jgi:hypothetical protein
LRTCRRFLPLGLLLLPLPAAAALTPVGAPLVIAAEPFCSFDPDVEVIATPKGAFEVVWVDETHFDVRGQRFARNLQPTGPPRRILPLHGGLNIADLVGTWAFPYELAMNVIDTGTSPGDPIAAYRSQIGIEGVPLGPAARVKPPRFVYLTPAAGGDSLQFRFEPPLFGPNTCRSAGLLAGRVARNGAPKSPESRLNRRASPPSGGFEVHRLPDDTFVIVYNTCQQFKGLVGRRLSSVGAPVGKPINLPLPDGFSLETLAAQGADDFVMGLTRFGSDLTVAGAYSLGVVNGQVFGPTRVAGSLGFGRLIELAVSPDGSYLALFEADGVLFAQQLDARGVPVDAPLEIPEADGFDIKAAAATALPNGRWIVVTRHQRDTECAERVEGIVLRED